MKSNALRALFLALVFLHALTIGAAAVPPSREISNAEVKRQLADYFANVAKNSPTVLGGIAKSPDTMQAVQQRIASMTDSELAPFRKMMAQAPDWRLAPEAMSKTFPPELLDQARRVAADYATRVPKAEEMRDDVETLTKVLRLLPESKLKELGIDRSMVASLEATIAGLSPVEAAILQRRVSESGPWDARSAAALDAIPPALQRGAAALAQHGPLTDKDVADLGSFRKELTAFLSRIDKLPPESRKALKVDEFRAQLRQLDAATPDVLFMVRQNVTPEMLTSLEKSVRFLERVSNLSDREKKDLETFRSDLGTAFRSAGDAGSPDVARLDETLAKMRPEELVVLRDALSTFGNWKVALPNLYQTLASPELPDRLKRVQGPAPDPAAVAELEAFRMRTLAELETAAATPGIDSALVDRTRERLQATPLPRLEVMRMGLGRLPQTASQKDRLAIIATNSYNFNCSVSMPDPVPNINLDFICNPIEDALQAIANDITNTVNSIVSSVRSTLESTINTVSSTLTSAINTVSNTVNSLVSEITSTVTSIASFARTIPSLAWEAIKTALNLLLDIEIRNGVTVRDLIGRGAEHALNSMKDLLGLAGTWWTAVSTFTLPLIPCPPSGFHTPFGNVGDGAAATNYARYNLLIDGIIGLIPDTETSLAVKIPAQVLYMMYNFLGVCLEQAAADADAAQATERHTIVLTNFANLQAFVGTQVAGLALTTGNQTAQLQSTIDTQATATRTILLAESSTLQSLLNSTNSTFQSLVNTKSTETKALIQRESDDTQADVSAFQTLNLRLAIERVLQSGQGKEIASFQLLEPLGYLRRVSDIVRETINAMAATNQGYGQAQKLYDDGVTLMNAGKEKDAFTQFSLAYRLATK